MLYLLLIEGLVLVKYYLRGDIILFFVFYCCLYWKEVDLIEFIGIKVLLIKFDLYVCFKY